MTEVVTIYHPCFTVGEVGGLCAANMNSLLWIIYWSRAISDLLSRFFTFYCFEIQAFLRHLRIYRGGRVKLPILDTISGIIRPSRYNWRLPIFLSQSMKLSNRILREKLVLIALMFYSCCRMTLLLGPPSSGKTTLLLALAGRLGPGLKVWYQINWICSFSSRMKTSWSDLCYMITLGQICSAT
jgi:hypothetical protein